MGSPDVRGPRMPIRHPACPGRNRCQIPTCAHNLRFWPDYIPIDMYRGVDMLGAFPPIRFARGWVYQRLDAVSERCNVRGIHDEGRAPTGTMLHAAQMTIREVSGFMLGRIRNWLSPEVPMYVQN